MEDMQEEEEEEKSLATARANHDRLYFTRGPGKRYWCHWKDNHDPLAIRFFQHTPEGLQFWYSQDCSPESLDKVKHATFVAIDVAGHHHDDFGDIGIAVLPTFPDALLDTPLDRVSTLSTLYGAQITNFRIKGKPLPEGEMERLSLGSEKELEKHEIKASLVRLVQQAKTEADAIGNDLVLVLFSSSGDLRTLVQLCPEIFAFFSWWTDLQAVVSKMDQDQVSKCPPSLGNTLRSLDLRTFADGGKPNTPKLRCVSANDAARTLAVLAGAVRMFRAGAQFHVKPVARSTERKPYDPNQTRHWKSRPRPKERFPFVVKVGRYFDPTQPRPRNKRGRQSPGFPQEYGGRPNLYEVFAAYRPTAIGVNHAGGNAGLWVCLPTREILEQFMRDHQGKESRHGRLFVRDLSSTDDYDTQEAVAKKLNDAHLQAALAQERKKGRNPWKENSKEYDIESVIFMAKGMSLD